MSQAHAVPQQGCVVAQRFGLIGIGCLPRARYSPFPAAQRIKCSLSNV